MNTKRVCEIWAIYFGTALICQLAIPNVFHTDFFAFPVNMTLLLLGIVGLWILYREKATSRLSLLLSSPTTTFFLLAVAVVTFLILGLTSWLTPASWWFFFVLTALSAHLLFVLFRGFHRNKPYRLRFLLNHAGLLLALIGGFAGGADTTQWRLRISGNETAQEAFAPDGSTMRLKQALKLEKFTVTHYPNGLPENYEAQISINDKEVVLRVNEPYGLSLSDDLYLVDYEHIPAGETTGYCILEIVRQPWKYVQWAGIWMMIAGSVLLFAQGVPSAKKRKQRNDME